jgi:hypothetical protein
MKSLARWVSIVGHPFVTAVITVTAVALRQRSPQEALRSALLVAVVALLPVGVLMARQVRKGHWENVDASNRAERPILFLVGMIAIALLLAAMLMFRPQSFLVRGLTGVMVMLAVCAVATRWIKVSLHMTFGAFSTTTLLCLGSLVGWTMLAFMPILAWSRLSMKRHRLLEVMIGCVIGAAFGYAVVRL